MIRDPRRSHIPAALVIAAWSGLLGSHSLQAEGGQAAAVQAAAPANCAEGRDDPDAAGGDQERKDMALRVQRGLEALAAGSGEVDRLTVTYDDIHGLHGGLRLTIQGDGRVQQKALRTKAGTPKQVSQADVGKLVALLLQHEVWEQRVPNREPKPDESRVRLEVAYGPDRVQIWEWYNDVERNKRIGKVLARMKEIAWE